MRLYPLAILVALSACASVPSGNDLSPRLASWIGAPAADLVAVLGEPVITKRGSWIWRFQGPEDGEYVPYRSSSAYARLRPVTSSVGGPSNAARMPGETRLVYGSNWSYHKRVGCKYIGYVENGIVTRLTTLSKPGNHCRFDELPLRSSS